MSPLFVRSGRHPVVVGILVALVATSLYGLLTNPPSKSIDLALPYPQRLIWSAQVLIAASVTLYGITRRNPEFGMRMEGIGWALVTIGLGCYDLMLWATTPWSSAGYVFCLVLGIASGAAWRVRQIAKDIRKYREVQALIA